MMSGFFPVNDIRTTSKDNHNANEDNQQNIDHSDSGPNSASVENGDKETTSKVTIACNDNANNVEDSIGLDIQDDQ